MQVQHHRQVISQKENPRDRVDQHIEISCPSSIVLPSLERYFQAHGNFLELITSGKDGANPEALAFVRNITATVKAHPNKSFLARYDDRLDIRWHSAHDLRLSFSGRLTIRPLGVATELTLKGKYDPPFLALEAMFRSVFDESAAQAIARALLEGLKTVLETEFALFNSCHV